MSEAAVVSDASPLHYLILIRAVELLPRLVADVFIPPAVAQELDRESTPPEVRQWMAQPPAWLKTVAPRQINRSLGLDLGETEAIALAIELGIRSIIIDERKGFRVAAAQGLEPLGLLAILELSAAKGWIDFEEYTNRLRRTNFRFREGLIAGALQRLQGNKS